MASVNKLFRTRSYSAVAVAEFRESQVRLLGLFQSFQVAAIREGRVRTSGARGVKKTAVADGRRAFRCQIEDNISLAELAGDVQTLSMLDAAHAAATRAPMHDTADAATTSVSRRDDVHIECGTLKAHDSSKSVRLPLNLSIRLRSSLTDRERRLLSLGEAFQKKVLCTFRVGKQHGGDSCSVKCTACSRYACIECHEAQRCSACLSSFCADCWDRGTPDMCGICHETICSDCRQQVPTNTKRTGHAAGRGAKAPELPRATFARLLQFGCSQLFCTTHLICLAAKEPNISTKGAQPMWSLHFCIKNLSNVISDQCCLCRLSQRQPAAQAAEQTSAPYVLSSCADTRVVRAQNTRTAPHATGIVRRHHAPVTHVARNAAPIASR